MACSHVTGSSIVFFVVLFRYYCLNQQMSKLERLISGVISIPIKQMVPASLPERERDEKPKRVSSSLLASSVVSTTYVDR